MKSSVRFNGVEDGVGVVVIGSDLHYVRRIVWRGAGDDAGKPITLGEQEQCPALG